MGEQVILNKPEEVTVANPFEITPKAFANFSPGFERIANPGIRTSIRLGTLQGFANRLIPFRVRPELKIRPAEVAIRRVSYPARPA